jgi:hypothetical protein
LSGVAQATGVYCGHALMFITPCSLLTSAHGWFEHPSSTAETQSEKTKTQYDFLKTHGDFDKNSVSFSVYVWRYLFLLRKRKRRCPERGLTTLKKFSMFAVC